MRLTSPFSSSVDEICAITCPVMYATAIQTTPWITLSWALTSQLPGSARSAEAMTKKPDDRYAKMSYAVNGIADTTPV